MLINENGRHISTSSVSAACRSVLAELRRQGMESGDRVLLSGANTERFVHTLFALMEYGVSVALVDPRVPDAEKLRLAAEAGADWILTDRRVDGEGARARRILLNELSTAAGPVDGGAEGTDGRATLTFERWFAREDALIVWSSGSTGDPKGIVRSGASVRGNTERTAVRMAYRAEDVLLPLLPFTHQYGLSILLLWWTTGCSLVLQTSSRRVDTSVKAIHEHGVTVVDTVPATYRTLLNLLDGGRADAAHLAPVRMWCVGGEPLPRELAEQFLRTTGHHLLDGYGSSEAGNIALAVEPDPVGCGRPLDGVRVEVVNSADRPVPAGEIGEILVHSPDYMTGLLGENGTVRRVDRAVYRTDDIGRLDEDGNLTVLGRKGAVHRLGHTVYPDGIAARAGACGAPVKVVAVPGERDRTHLVFFVVDPQQRTADHWKGEVSAFLAEYERPNRVVVLPEFPLNGNGKIDRRELQKMAVTAMTREEHRSAPAPAYRIPFEERLEALDAVVGLLHERREEFLEILFETCNHPTAVGEIHAALTALDGARKEIQRYRPRRVEQMAVLMPSNIPLYSYILYLLIPTLYSERVVFRPSGRISDQTEKLHKLIGTVHDLPIQQCLTGQRDFLNGEADRSEVLVFTGTFDNAEKVRAQLRKDQLFLYFGQGVNPFVVGRDADIGRAVEGALKVRLMNSGQDCFGPDVFFVHTSVSSQFCNLLSRRVNALRHGRYKDPTADYGSMFYLDAFEDALAHLIQNRAYIAAGGNADLAEGHLSPTLLIRPVEANVLPPELFAPIFDVVPYTDPAWLRTMLSHQFFEERAMAATVYGEEPELVEMLGRRHTVSVNQTLIDIEDGNAPFGGTGVRANYAAYGGKRHTQPLLISKAVVDHLGGAA
ncbi:2-succinylbenzoate--CoA ligase [Streptomyces sp. RB5]|uniref:2-succinylbenzoate--CoA ligase n=1 Tax=Streptomyces smaragdinus TaxID=2585196 RepID=A0A7K0CE08_9ACTN|nr:aldehyde dehydrogenase family protein [Streptomyces smaragdinus]MQY11302.1 2-succinylbenzoate--CoA ligase [Streptomyces smaragdinus]